MTFQPPITVGELTDVPAPRSAVVAPFHQEVANRVIHRFPSTTAMTNSNLVDGSLAYVTGAGGRAYYERRGGIWSMTTLQAGSTNNIESSQITSVGAGTTPITFPTVGTWMFSWFYDISAAAGGWGYLTSSPKNVVGGGNNGLAVIHAQTFEPNGNISRFGHSGAYIVDITTPNQQLQIGSSTFAGSVQRNGGTAWTYRLGPQRFGLL